jgi:sugar transferase (PEP-CTERM system associated)
MAIRILKHYIPAPVVVLAVVDGLILFGAMYLGLELRLLAGDIIRLEAILPVYPKAATFAVVMVMIMIALGLYDRDIKRGDVGYYARFLMGFAIGFAVMTLIFYVVPQVEFGRGAFALTFLFGILGTVVARTVFTRVVDHEKLKRRLLVLGTGSRPAHIESVLRDHNLDDRFHVVGYVPMGGTQHSVDRSRILPKDRPLLSLANHYHVDDIIVGVRERRGGNVPMGELLECRLEGVSVLDLPSFFEREMGRVQLDSLNPSWMVFSDGFDRSSYRNLVKRTFDIFASIALLALMLPVVVITAAAILIESGRPLLYRQERVGECGRTFELLKFRSMTADAEGDGKPRWAEQNDRRITRVGRIIRLLRIDEIPQVFNVLKGEMSFVGPRPERPYFVAQLAKHIPYYRSRHTVRPGITGWAQIRYAYGASVEDAREKLQYDLYYAKNHTLFLDVLILLQTTRVVLFGRGAR